MIKVRVYSSTIKRAKAATLSSRSRDTDKILLLLRHCRDSAVRASAAAKAADPVDLQVLRAKGRTLIGSSGRKETRPNSLRCARRKRVVRVRRCRLELRSFKEVEVWTEEDKH